MKKVKQPAVSIVLYAAAILMWLVGIAQAHYIFLSFQSQFDQLLEAYPFWSNLSLYVVQFLGSSLSFFGFGLLLFAAGIILHKLQCLTAMSADASRTENQQQEDAPADPAGSEYFGIDGDDEVQVADDSLPDDITEDPEDFS